MSFKTPLEVSNAIKKLSSSDQVLVQTFIGKLKAHVADLEQNLHANDHVQSKCTHDHSQGHDHSHAHSTHHEGSSHEKAAASDPVEVLAEPSASLSIDEDDFPPLFGDDANAEQNPEMAATNKSLASDLKASGDYKGALESFTLAVLQAEPSALLYANRADCLLRLSRPYAAIRDCDEALKLNPDSAKALKIRGRAKKSVGDWKGSRKDLSESQTIDFDDEAVEDLKFVSEKAREVEMEEAKKRLEETEHLKRKSQKVQVETEQEKKKTAAAAPSPTPAASAARSASGNAGFSGMGGGLPPGMSGMLGSLMSDPELAAGMQNPKVMSAFTELMQSPGGAASLMSNPAKIQKLMSDPEVGPFMQKLISKFGPMLGASMAGGMGGMGNMGGMGSHFDGDSGGGGFSSGDDDVPDVPEL